MANKESSSCDILLPRATTLSARLHLILLPRLLFWLNLGVATLLVSLVLLCPLLDQGAARTHGWRRLVAVFARDSPMRRTALGSALGLAVTACVFFQPPRLFRSSASRACQPPPGNVAGA